jgi:dipeptidyl aminopeptidase/acylaminoacyl peptidase
LFMTLKQSGCETEFVRYPGGAHAMLRTGYPSHKADFMERINDWFSRYLMGSQ